MPLMMIIITMTMMMLRVVVVRATPAIDGVTHEGLLRGQRGKVRVSAHHQRLRDHGLEPTMRLLGDAVLMRAPGRDAAGDPAHPWKRREARSIQPPGLQGFSGSSTQPEKFTGNRTIRDADRRMLDWICDPGVQ